MDVRVVADFRYFSKNSKFSGFTCQHTPKSVLRSCPVFVHANQNSIFRLKAAGVISCFLVLNSFVPKLLIDSDFNRRHESPV